MPAPSVSGRRVISVGQRSRAPPSETSAARAGPMVVSSAVATAACTSIRRMVPPGLFVEGKGVPGRAGAPRAGAEPPSPHPADGCARPPGAPLTARPSAWSGAAYARARHRRRRLPREEARASALRARRSGARARAAARRGARPRGGRGPDRRRDRSRDAAVGGARAGPRLPPRRRAARDGRRRVPARERRVDARAPRRLPRRGSRPRPLRARRFDGDRENLLFFRIARAHLALDFGDRPLSWIDVDDCARGFLLLADRPEARGEAFFLASAETTTAAGLMREAARALGVGVRRVPVPSRALRASAALADVVSAATGRRLPLNRKLAAQLLAPGWVCDPAKAKAKLGFEATTPLADSIGRAARWYVDHRWI